MTAIDRAVAEIIGDDPVCRLGRMGHAAGDLGHLDPVGQEAERHRLGVGLLHLQPVPADGPAVEARGGAGLEPAHLQAGTIEVSRQAGGGGLAVTSGRDALVALVNDTVQEGAGGQDHSPGAQFDALPRHHADDPVAVQDQPLRRPGHQGQVGRLRQFGLHGLAVKPPVDLATGPPHGRPLGPVQQAELNPGLVAQSGHQTVHGIDLADQMALAQPADRRVAGHFSDGLEFLGQQHSASAHAR